MSNFSRANKCVNRSVIAFQRTKLVPITITQKGYKFVAKTLITSVKVAIHYRKDQEYDKKMNSFNTLLFAFALFVASCAAIPVSTSIQSQDDDAIPSEERKILVISPDQALEVVPLGPEPPKTDGEMMDTANAMVYRPLFAYRRIQRRKYRYPLRRSGYYSSEDRFPTLA